MSTEDKREPYEKLLEILYPNYQEMSFKRKDFLHEVKERRLVGNARQIEVILEEMRKTGSSIHQEGMSEKDLIRIADIYVGFHETARFGQKAVPTGRVLRGGRYGDTPVEEYRYVNFTEAEKEEYIRNAVEEYNKQPKISIKNVLGGIKKYELTKETALRVSSILKEMENGTRSDITKEKDEEMGL